MSEKTKQGSMLRRHRIMTLDEAREYLFGLLDHILDDGYNKLCKMVLDNPGFWTCPAAKGRHQAYPGGLAIHTAQMCKSALDLLHSVEDVRFEEMIVAALWHDIGKIADYSIVPANPFIPEAEKEPVKYEYTEHQKLIGHLPKSYALFCAETQVEKPYDEGMLYRLTQESIDFIGHLILAHHGRKEWGSPVEPLCAEAWALHAADMLSSQFIEDA